MIAVLAAAAFACGAVSRPGIAERGGDGVWRGGAVAICELIAAGAAPGARVVFHGYDRRDALRAAARDRVSFVSAAEAALAGLIAGPVVSVERQYLSVAPASPVRTQADLAGRVVCFIVGTRAEDALPGNVVRLGFQEPDEMADGLASGKCAGVAADAEDEIAAPHRTLLPPLHETEIVAATPPGDPAWTARVRALLSVPIGQPPA